MVVVRFFYIHLDRSFSTLFFVAIGNSNVITYYYYGVRWFPFCSTNIDPILNDKLIDEIKEWMFDFWRKCFKHWKWKWKKIQNRFSFFKKKTFNIQKQNDWKLNFENKINLLYNWTTGYILHVQEMQLNELNDRFVIIIS